MEQTDVQRRRYVYRNRPNVTALALLPGHAGAPAGFTAVSEAVAKIAATAVCFGPRDPVIAGSFLVG